MTNSGQLKLQLATSRLLAGRRILRIELNPFDSGRGWKAYDPAIYLDNGAVLTFTVQETESTEYGIKPTYSRRAAPRRKALRTQGDAP